MSRRLLSVKYTTNIHAYSHIRTPVNRKRFLTGVSHIKNFKGFLRFWSNDWKDLHLNLFYIYSDIQKNIKKGLSIQKYFAIILKLLNLVIFFETQFFWKMLVIIPKT